MTMLTEVTTAKQVLEHAARYIEEVGWCQGEFRNRQGSVCLHGAINMVTLGHPIGVDRVSAEAKEALVDYFIKTFDYTITPIAWNDQPDRTQAEVVEALRAAADRL